MASYEIRFQPSVEKDLRSLPKDVIARAMKRIWELKNNPFPPGAKNSPDPHDIIGFVSGIIVLSMRWIPLQNASRFITLAIGRLYIAGFEMGTDSVMAPHSMDRGLPLDGPAH
jgi:hypothetical protein